MKYIYINIYIFKQWIRTRAMSCYSNSFVWFHVVQISINPGQTAADACDDAELADLKAGTCTSSQACTCTAGSLAQTIGSFNKNLLECSGYDSCRSAAQHHNANFFKFKDPSSYLVCKGYHSCREFWNVENVGAACCTASDSCYNGAKIHLTQDASSRCINDICCSAYRACSQSEFKHVHSLSCSGNLACQSLTVDVERDPCQWLVRLSDAVSQSHFAPKKLFGQCHETLHLASLTLEPSQTNWGYLLPWFASLRIHVQLNHFRWSALRDLQRYERNDLWTCQVPLYTGF